MEKFKTFLVGMAGAVVNGAATGAATIVTQPAGPIDWKQVGSIALVGAVFGGVSYILKSPLGK